MATILFVCESVALAHVSRSVLLAETLDTARFDVHIACDARYEWVVRDSPHAQFHALSSIEPAHFIRQADRGERIYSQSDAERYLNDELRLYAGVRPDLVIGDLRYSASTSAACAGIPSAVLVNAAWSPYRELDFSPDPPRKDPTVQHRTPLATRIARKGLRTLTASRRDTGPYDLNAFNRLRTDRGLAPFGDYLQLMIGADHVLYPEPPELVTMSQLPPQHRFIGPVSWSPRLPVPDWWDQLPADRPLIYVSMGSTGETSRLPQVVQQLAALDVTVLVATAGRAGIDGSRANVRVADLLPGKEACARADVVLSSGGSATAYQAISEGTPVVGLWSNEAQYLTSMILARHGAAIAHPPYTPAEDVVRSVSDVLGNRSYRGRARALAEIFGTCDAREQFPKVVDEIVGDGTSP